MHQTLEVAQKESAKFRVRDLPARIIGIPIIAFFMHLKLHAAPSDSLLTGLSGYSVSLLYTLSYWEGLRLIWMKLQRRYSHYNQTARRIFTMTGIVLVYGVVVTLFIECFMSLLFHYQCTQNKIIYGYFKGLIPTTLVLMVYESVYFFHSWKTKVLEAESLARTQLISQLEALKSQLDPHFLFNSLNTLSSLIDDNQPAQHYLNHLADVYRYVLLSKDRDTVSLKEEMEFVQAYLYLAQVRFQDGLKVHIDLPENLMQQKVAPMSVQLLVENALKHNVITQSNPLHVYIEANGPYLWVRNAIRPKVKLEESTKLGLSNILERYRLLTELPVQIINDQMQFRVALPLIG